MGSWVFKNSLERNASYVTVLQNNGENLQWNLNHSNLKQR